MSLHPVDGILKIGPNAPVPRKYLGCEPAFLPLFAQLRILGGLCHRFGRLTLAGRDVFHSLIARRIVDDRPRCCCAGTLEINDRSGWPLRGLAGLTEGPGVRPALYSGSRDKRMERV